MLYCLEIRRCSTKAHVFISSGLTHCALFGATQVHSRLTLQALTCVKSNFIPYRYLLYLLHRIVISPTNNPGTKRHPPVRLGRGTSKRRESIVDRILPRYIIHRHRCTLRQHQVDLNFRPIQRKLPRHLFYWPQMCSDDRGFEH